MNVGVVAGSEERVVCTGVAVLAVGPFHHSPLAVAEAAGGVIDLGVAGTL